MKTVPMEKVTLECCVAEAQQEKVILTRNGHPVALVTSVDGMDEEPIRLSNDPVVSEAHGTAGFCPFLG